MTSLRPDPSWQPLAPFWASTARHELRVPQCDDCRRYQWYPRPLCPRCLSDRFSWNEVSRNGTVYSYSIVRHRFDADHDREPPYAVIQVHLDEAQGVMLLANLVHVGQQPDLRIGQRARIEFVQEGMVTLPAVVVTP